MTTPMPLPSLAVDLERAGERAGLGLLRRLVVIGVADTLGCGAVSFGIVLSAVVTRGGAPARNVDATEATGLGPVTISARVNSCSA